MKTRSGATYSALRQGWFRIVHAGSGAWAFPGISGSATDERPGPV